MKLLSEGCWELKSKIDPRWNSTGSCDVGGFVMPEDCKIKIEALTQQYGKPPIDLSWQYHKH